MITNIGLLCNSEIHFYLYIAMCYGKLDHLRKCIMNLPYLEQKQILCFLYLSKTIKCPVHALRFHM